MFRSIYVGQTDRRQQTDNNSSSAERGPYIYLVIQRLFLFFR